MHQKRCFYIHFPLLCAAWLLCLAVYFPGVGMNDGLNVLMGRLASANQFPIWYCVYVVILGHIGNLLGSLQYAVAIYSVLQILITAAISAGIITWVYSKTINRILRGIVSAYYLLCPVLAIYSIAMIKDTVFSAALVAYGILLYELYQRKGVSTRRLQVLTVLMMLLVATLRSNGLYIVIVCLIIQWFSCRRARRLTGACALLLLCVTLSGNAIMSHYNVHRTSSETLAIPIQQIGAVVAEDGEISEDDLQVLSHFIDPDDLRELYQPGNVDNVKWSDAFNRQYLNNHIEEFLSLWARLLPDNLSIYVDAYLTQTYWFWAPDPRGSIQTFDSIEVVADNEWLNDFLTENGIHDAPILAGDVGQTLRNWYQTASRYPQEGVCLWIMILSLVVTAIRGRSLRRPFLFYLPQILCWLTIMVSTPINNSYRYVLYYAYAMPLYLWFAIRSNQTQS